MGRRQKDIMDWNGISKGGLVTTAKDIYVLPNIGNLLDHHQSNWCSALVWAVL